MYHLVCHGNFTGKIVSKQADRGAGVFRSKAFNDALESIDRDDASASICENERQHGRLRQRVVFGGSHQSLVAGITAAHISEWQSEHISHSDASDSAVWVKPVERVRQAIHHQNELTRELKQTRGTRAAAGGPKLLFTIYMDACHKREQVILGQHRAQAEFLADRERWHTLYDSLPDTDELKAHFIRVYKERLQRGRMARDYLHSEECVSDILDKMFEALNADWQTDPSSTMGIGCKKYPLSPTVLKAGFAAEQTTSLRTMHQAVHATCSPSVLLL